VFQFSFGTYSGVFDVLRMHHGIIGSNKVPFVDDYTVRIKFNLI